MKVVTEETKNEKPAGATVANGYTRLYNKIDGSTVDVHAVDGREYIKRLPHLWSNTPIAKEQAKAEDAVIVPEPAKEDVKFWNGKSNVKAVATIEPVAEVAPVIEEKPVSARSRRLAKFED